MIGSVHDVLLAIVNGSDTVNDWRNKTNAIIDYLNKTPTQQLPSILFASEPPLDDSYLMWFDTTNMTLMTKFSGEWRQFHQVYAHEVKLYQKVINSNKTIPAGYNALAVSPTVAEGVILEITEGSILKVV